MFDYPGKQLSSIVELQERLQNEKSSDKIPLKRARQPLKSQGILFIGGQRPKDDIRDNTTFLKVISVNQ